MSVCRSRGRPRLGGSGNQDLEDPVRSSQPLSEGWSGGNARGRKRAHRQNYAVLNRRSQWQPAWPRKIFFGVRFRSIQNPSRRI
jgi:hypothetical protein